MIFIKNATIVTQNKSRQIIKDGAVVIEKDKIIDIGKSKDLEKKYRKKFATGSNNKIIDGEGKVVMPGLINTHTHLAMTLLRGYADDLCLEEWLYKKVFPAESKFTENDVYRGTLLGAIEAVKSGTTYLSDMYYFPDEVAKAIKKVGVRANIGVGVLDFPTFAFKNIEKAIDQAIQAVKRWENDGLVKISVSPHMIQTTSLETYKACKKLAKKYGILLQTHLAETEQEVKYSMKKYHNTPAEVLVNNKILDKNSLVAHGCWLDDKDIKLLAKNRISVSHCPISNMKLVSGVMPLTKLVKAGVNVSLGTDGTCSNNNLDMFEEMKFAALLHKINEKDPTAASAQIILDMATINGAKALGEEKRLGSIEKGKIADLIMLDFNRPHLSPCSNVVSHLVYAAGGADVETVVINGKIVMQNRKVLTINERSILKKIKTSHSRYE